MADRVVIVTGSTTGIGRAIADAFASSGWRVAVNGRNADSTAAAAAEIEAAGGRALAVPADVTDPAAVRAMVDRVAGELGPVDAIVCNAGIPGPRSFAQDVGEDEFLEVLKTNLWGAFLSVKYVLPSMIERGQGRIVTMTGGGAATERPLRGGLAYGSSKAGVEGMTRNLALEVSRFGITVNAISPGRVDTRGFPRNEAEERRGVPYVSPEAAARLAVWLAGSDEAAETTGETIDARAWAEEHKGD